ncbi:hypothetical protein [Campylobacter rectus]|nr:hypothetical protein [Campylobacter rectus]
MDYLEMKLEAVSFPNLARLVNLPKFTKAKLKTTMSNLTLNFGK